MFFRQNFPSPRHWHGAIRPSVSESRQMRQKTGCCCSCSGCCCEEEDGSVWRPACLGVLGNDVDSTPAGRAVGAEEQRIDAAPAVAVVRVDVSLLAVAGTVSPGRIGGRGGGLLSMWSERASEREREKRETSGKSDEKSLFPSKIVSDARPLFHFRYPSVLCAALQNEKEKPLFLLLEPLLAASAFRPLRL